MDCEIRDSDGIREIFLKGSFTLREGEVFRQILADLRVAEVAEVVLDLSGLDYMDSAGLGKLILLRDAANERTLKLRIRGPQGRVKKILDLSRFHEEIPIETGPESQD